MVENWDTAQVSRWSDVEGVLADLSSCENGAPRARGPRVSERECLGVPVAAVPGGFRDGHVWPLGAGGRDRGVGRAAPSEAWGASAAGRRSHACVSTACPVRASLRPSSPFGNRGASPVGLGPALRAVSKGGPILRCWGLEHPHVHREGTPCRRPRTAGQGAGVASAEAPSW